MAEELPEKVEQESKAEEMQQEQEPSLGFDPDPEIAAAQHAHERGIMHDYLFAPLGSIAQDSARREMWGD